MSIEKLAGVIADILNHGSKPLSVIDVEGGGNILPHRIVIGAHGNAEFLTEPESVRTCPARIKQDIQINTVGDFISYVNRYTGPVAVIVKANPFEPVDPFDHHDGAGVVIQQDRNAPSALKNKAIIAIAPSLTGLVKAGSAGTLVATAVLDFHESSGVGSDGVEVLGDPGWKQHTAKFMATAHPRYVQVVQHDGTFMAQAAFIQWLEVVARYCVSHDPAALMELIQNLRLTQETQISSVTNPRDGSCDLVYKVDVTAHGGTRDKPVTVPSHLTFRVPMLQGGADIDVVATLRYRGRDSKVEFGAFFVDRPVQELEALEALADQIAHGTGVQTLIGTVA